MYASPQILKFYWNRGHKLNILFVNHKFVAGLCLQDQSNNLNLSVLNVREILNTLLPRSGKLHYEHILNSIFMRLILFTQQSILKSSFIFIQKNFILWQVST